jgi:hypothetical protein
MTRRRRKEKLASFFFAGNEQRGLLVDKTRDFTSLLRFGRRAVGRFQFVKFSFRVYTFSRLGKTKRERTLCNKKAAERERERGRKRERESALKERERERASLCPHTSRTHTNTEKEKERERKHKTSDIKESALLLLFY